MTISEVELFISEVLSDGPCFKNLWEAWDDLRPYFKSEYSDMWGRHFLFVIDECSIEILTFDDNYGNINSYGIWEGEGED